MSDPAARGAVRRPSEDTSIRQWPPLLWPAMALASLLILMGLGSWKTPALVAGAVLALCVFATSAYLAVRASRDRPWPRGARAVIGAFAGFYALSAGAAAVAGSEYALAALFAAVIPLSAALIIVATARMKTAPGGPEDRSATDHEDPVPGIGLDGRTPLGDTREHSDADA